MRKIKEVEDYSEREAQRRFEAALRGGLKTPHTSLKEKPKVNAVAKKRPPSKKTR